MKKIFCTLTAFFLYGSAVFSQPLATGVPPGLPFNASVATGILPTANGGTGYSSVSNSGDFYAEMQALGLLPFYGSINATGPFDPATNATTIIGMGDSILEGTGPSANYLSFFAGLVQQYATTYGPAGGGFSQGGFCPTTGNATCAPSLSGAWTGVNIGPYQASLTNQVQRGASSATATLTSGSGGIGQTTEIDISYYTYTDSAPFSVSVNGTSLGTFGGAQTSSYAPSIQRIINNGVNAATITNAGSGYTNGTYTLGVSGGTCSTTPVGTYTISGNVLASIIFSNVGVCTVVPTLAFSSGGGSSAAATAILANWTIPNTTNTVLTAPSSGAVYFWGFFLKNAPSGAWSGVTGWNVAQPSAKSGMFTSDLSWLSTVPNAKLAIVGLGQNDINGITPAQFVANLTTIYSALIAQSIAELLLITEPNSSNDSCVSAPPITYCQKDYVNAELAWAQSNNIPVVDIYHRWGSYANGNALGLYADTVHPSNKGANDILKAIINQLQPAPPSYNSGININATNTGYGFHQQYGSNTPLLIDGYVSPGWNITNLAASSSGTCFVDSGTIMECRANAVKIETTGSNYFFANGNGTNAIVGNTTLAGTLQTSGAISDVSTTANATVTANGHETSGGGAYFDISDDVLGNIGYFGQNSVIFGGTSYKEFSIINPQSGGTVCIAANSGGSSTANTGCDILIDASNNVTVSHAFNPPSARKGTFVCTGAGTISISNTNMAATSNVIISMNAQGGTITTPPAMKTVTASTGFTVLCGATDTSTYNYAILN